TPSAPVLRCCANVDVLNDCKLLCCWKSTLAWCVAAGSMGVDCGERGRAGRCVGAGRQDAPQSYHVSDVCFGEPFSNSVVVGEEVFALPPIEKLEIPVVSV